MKKYTVTVYKTVVERADIVIEAEDWSKAEEKYWNDPTLYDDQFELTEECEVSVHSVTERLPDVIIRRDDNA